MDCARARVLAHIAKLLLELRRAFAFSLVGAVPIQECETYIYRKIGALRRLGSSLARNNGMGVRCSLLVTALFFVHRPNTLVCEMIYIDAHIALPFVWMNIHMYSRLVDMILLVYTQVHSTFPTAILKSNDS